MAKKQKLAKGRKPTNQYQKQKYADRRAFITERNRLRKRRNHVKRHPRDAQTAKLLT